MFALRTWNNTVRERCEKVCVVLYFCECEGGGGGSAAVGGLNKMLT